MGDDELSSNKNMNNTTFMMMQVGRMNSKSALRRMKKMLKTLLKCSRQPENCRLSLKVEIRWIKEY